MAVNLTRCPDCGTALLRLKNGPFSLLKCGKCGYQLNERTGEVIRAKHESYNILVQCPFCKGKVRIENGKPGKTAVCPFCSKEFVIPQHPDPSLRIHTVCPHCSSENRVPANKGRVKIHCGNCGQDYLHNTGTWPGQKAAPKYGQSTAPKSSQGAAKKPSVSFNPGTNEWVTTCPHCKQEMTVEKGGGVTEITHGTCGKKLYFDCDNGRFPVIGADGSVDNKWMFHCPDCGHIWRVVKNTGIVHFNCDCGRAWAINSATGKPVSGKTTPSAPTFDPKTNCWLTICPHCGQSAEVAKGSSMQEVTHHACGKTWYFDGQKGRHLSKKADGSVNGHWVYHCPKCDQLWFMQQNTGIADTHCPCGHHFKYDTNAGKVIPGQSAAKPKQQTPPKQTYQQPKTQTPPKQTAQQPKPQTPPKQPQPAPQPKPAGKPCRTLLLERPTHAYKEWDFDGLKNRFKDAYPVHIFLDDEDMGNLAANGTMELEFDSNEHHVKCALLATSYRIPAGTESYVGFCFNDKLELAPVGDPFINDLTDVILTMFRGQGIRDRIRDSNNRNHNIQMHISKKGVRLYWQVEKTKGLLQWATGCEEENFTYAQLGLTPPAEERQPDGYWNFIESFITDAIIKDPEADMDRYMGGFTFRTKHSLF